MTKIISGIVVGLAIILCMAGNLTAQPYGLENRVPNSSLLISISGLTSLETKRVFPNLVVNDPLGMVHAGDGSNRLFVLEQPGRIRVFANDTSDGLATVFLNIQSQVEDGPGEAGLLGLAFHPSYQNNGRFYVYYTTPENTLTSRISEFQVSSSDSNAADPLSERVLFEYPQPEGNHNGGQLAFGPDGYLYIALGDGGGSGDPFDNGQDITTPLGAILRIDVDSTQTGLEYAIPPDNPFTTDTLGYRDEIWAYGLRNPWRFSFDTDGTLYAGDVGQGDWEEIDIIKKGLNYGWNVMEGNHCYDGPCDTTGLEKPIYEYNHSEGQSITGGYVYRGSSLTDMVGAYIYGDYVSRKIWALRYENGEVTENSLVAESPASISSFAVDENNEIYVVGYNGTIHMLVESGEEPVNTVPDSISNSGLYKDMLNKEFSDGLIEYDVNASFWSDGSFKERVLALPDTTKIMFDQTGDWGWPSEAVIVKNFYVEMVEGDTASRRLIETRFLVKRSSGDLWNGYSYWWFNDESDAYLLPDSATRQLTIANPDCTGGSYIRDYYYPSRNECLECHTPAAGDVLGVHTAQTNKDFLYDNGVTDNQLRSYNNIRLFTEDIGEDYTGWPQWPDPTDSTEALEDRARSYLASNCANCHLPGGTGRTNMDMQYATPLEQTNMLDIDPELGDLGVTGAKRIMSGAADSSVVYLRMIDHGEYRMPPLATNRIDTEGSQLIENWINSLDDQSVPVSLVQGSFAAAYNFQAGEIRVGWRTGSEVNSSFFEVYRDMTAENGEKLHEREMIARVDARGNSSAGHDYSIADKGIPDLSSEAFTCRYELFQQDVDGARQYLGQASVEVLPKAFDVRPPYPNPANGRIKVRYALSQKSNLTFTLFNIRGQKVHSEKRQHEKGVYTFDLALDELSSQLYFLKINGRNKARDDFNRVFKVLVLK